MAIVSVPLTETWGTKKVEHLMTTLLADVDHLNSALGPVPLSQSCGIDHRPMSMRSRTSVSPAGEVQVPLFDDGRSLMPVKQDSHRWSRSTPPRV